MATRFSRYLGISTAVHIGLVILLVLLPALARWLFRREKPREIVTYVELQAAAPDEPNVVPVEKIKEPPPPKPQPAPQPKIRKSTKRVRREPPEPTRPRIDPDEIRKHLEKVIDKPVRTSTSTTPFAWYYTMVRQALYDAWEQPSGLADLTGRTVDASLVVERNGSVTSARITRPSGHPALDESVRRALRAVRTLPALPSDFPRDREEIDITFQLTKNLP